MGHFSVFSEYAEALNEIILFLGVERETLIRHMPTRHLVEKTEKGWPAVK